MEPDLSIIIVNWNTKDYLAGCLDSIKDNTQKVSYEIIAVDNCSSDGSADMVERDFPEVLLIRNEENAGFGRANNQGLAKAKGKYILFLNSDMAVNENCLDRMFAFMEENPRIGASACKLTFPDGRLQHSCRQFPSFKVYFLMILGLRYLFPNLKVFRHYLMLDWDHSDTREVDQIMGSFMFMRRSALDEAGHFDERFWMYFEEVDLCLRLKKAGWKIVHYPQASAVHFLSKSSEQWGKLKVTREFQKSLLKYFKKNRNVVEYTTLLALSGIKYGLLLPFLKLTSRV